MKRPTDRIYFVARQRRGSRGFCRRMHDSYSFSGALLLQQLHLQPLRLLQLFVLIRPQRQFLYAPHLGGQTTAMGCNGGGGLIGKWRIISGCCRQFTSAGAAIGAAGGRLATNACRCGAADGSGGGCGRVQPVCGMWIVALVLITCCAVRYCSCCCCLCFSYLWR